MSIESTVILGGFATAVVLGAVAQRSNFCTMGALSDVVNMGHWGRMRMWVLAMAVAIAGTTALSQAGLIDLPQAVAMRPRLPWLSLLLGGLLFGVGMTYAGGCANKNLLRVGGGSLRSLVVLLVLAVSASMTLKGLFGQWRASYLDPVAIDLAALGWKDQGLPTLLQQVTGLAPQQAAMAAAGVLVLAMLAWVFADKRFRGNGLQMLGGVVIGGCVVVGWYISGHLGFGENPETLEMTYFATNTRAMESMSFVAPLAFGLELLQRWTDQSLKISFGIATVLGVMLGAGAMSLATKSFRWEGFASVDDLRNQVLGATLMGFGGVTALGCTVGQGLTGISTLAIGSFLALAGIIGGSVATLKYMLWRAEQD
ncbi:YeeE/YedE family protein [Ideonella sp. 4Y11]|uniref:YeeE/YedE family protein n=1 Tax=Ideonella aquatica TaxID=2824119 RepID=A0A941BMI1_9BURK|nr:YeeE/YedE family protein [Ideonella aquatica]MBQ0960869.1 YeeE/YedE family protein [Ideonella aquatica]